MKKVVVKRTKCLPKVVVPRPPAYHSTSLRHPGGVAELLIERTESADVTQLRLTTLLGNYVVFAAENYAEGPSREDIHNAELLIAELRTFVTGARKVLSAKTS